MAINEESYFCENENGQKNKIFGLKLANLVIQFPPKWAKFTNFQPVGFEAPCIFFILAKKIRLSENPISLKNKHARVVLHFWSKCKKSSKKECVIPLRLLSQVINIVYFFFTIISKF